MLGTAAAGLYGAAYRVVWLPIIFVTAYYTALRPSLARAWVGGIALVGTLMHRSIRLTSAMSVVVGGVMLAGPVVDLLYGPTYGQAVVPLQLLLGALALLAVSRNYRSLLAAFNHQTIDLTNMGAAAVVNVLLNIILIRRLGLTGAALATLCSKGTILVLGYIATRRLISHMPLGRYLVKPWLCALVMALVLVATHALPVLPRIALGGAVYLASLFLLRVIIPEEVRIVFSAWLPARPAAS